MDLKTLAAALLISSLCLPLAACRRDQDEAPPPAPSAAEPGAGPTTSMPPGTTAPGPDASIGVGAPPPDTTTSTNDTSGTTGTDEHRSAGVVMDDTVISTKVKAALIAEPNLKAGDVNVDTHEGQVMLSGYLDSQDQIDRAVQIARGVEGVKNVDNKLSLRK
jgi:hypothetical protein